MIKLLADSTCDLSQEIVDRYNIGIAPLNIEIEGVNYRDKIDITSDQFFEQLPEMQELPKTGAPSPEAYLAIIEESLAEGYTEFLCICMSSGTSASYQSAEIAKELFYDKHEDTEVKIHVVDSWSMSHGSGWLIVKSAQLLEAGYTFEELIKFNETYRRRVKHFLCVDDLHNLIKSGRISNEPKIANDLKERIETQTDFAGDIYIMQMGVAVGTHVGLGGVSMFFMEKENM